MAQASQYAPQRRAIEAARADKEAQRQASLSAYASWLPQQPFGQSEVANQIINAYEANRQGATTSQDVMAEMSRFSDVFRSMFRNYVGRDPNRNEYDQFFNTVVIQQAPWTKPVDWTSARQDTQSLLSQQFLQEAQKESQRKAQEEAAAAIAPGSAFDVWQQGYRNSLTETEKALQDYQTRLFEKLRPQLLTSLQSQGLLNTGALNEAFAGAAKDLGEASQNYLAQARTGVEQDIANQKYQIQGLPYQQQANFTLGQVPNLMQSGQNALQNAWQASLANLNAQNQQRLMSQTADSGHSLLNQFGGQLLGGVAGGIGAGLAGGWMRKPTYIIGGGYG